MRRIEMLKAYDGKGITLLKDHLKLRESRN